MTKRKSLIATFSLALALSLALVFGVTLSGGTLTAKAAEAPSCVTVAGKNASVILYDGYYLENNEATEKTNGAKTEPENYVAWYYNGVLTLNNFSGKQISFSGVDVGDKAVDLTIKLKGENTINSSTVGISGENCENLVITADEAATLNITVSSETKGVCGIGVGMAAGQKTGSVTIKGNAAVNIDCATANYNASYGIYACDTFSIEEKANLSVICKLSHETNNTSYCIVSGKNKPLFNTDGVITLDISDSVKGNYCISANNGIDMQNGTLICRYIKGTIYSYACSKTISAAPEGCVLREEPYYLGETVIKSGEGHTVTVENGMDNYERNENQYVADETVTIKTTIDGLPFKGWKGEGVTFKDATQKETTFTMVGNDVTVTAVYDVFAKQPVFERINDGKGSISVQLNKQVSDIREVELVKSTDEVDEQVFFSFKSSSESYTYVADSVWANYTPKGTYKIRVKYSNYYYFYSDPFEIDYTDKTPSVSISDVTISGKKGIPITPVDIKITLSNATFKAIPANTNVKTWFKSSLPLGLIATIGEVTEGATSATITINGAANTTWTPGPITICIPKDFLATGNEKDISAVTKDVCCEIVEPAKCSVKVENGRAFVNEENRVTIEECSTVKIKAFDKEGEGKDFDKWVVVSGGITLADETSSETTFTMPPRDVEIKATYKDKPHEHTYGTLIPEKTATCVATGMKAHYKCSVCEKLFDESKAEKTAEQLTIALDSNAHKFGDWVAEVPATCVATGTKGHKVCSLCNKNFDNEGKEIANLEISINSTAHVYGELITKVPATCVATGMNAHYKCSVCEKLFDESKAEKTKAELEIAIDSNAHKFGDWVAEVSATCVATGKKGHKTCTLCNKNFDKNGVKLDELTIGINRNAHTRLETKWTGEKDGHYHVCGDCDGHDEIKPHNPDRAAATETEAQKCADCGYVMAAALGHTHKIVLSKEVPATCTKNGVKAYYVCEGCGHKFKDDKGVNEITDESALVIPAAHKFGEWIEEIPATTEKEGVKAHKDCTVCHKHFDKNGNEIDDITLEKLPKEDEKESESGSESEKESESESESEVESTTESTGESESEKETVSEKESDKETVSDKESAGSGTGTEIKPADSKPTENKGLSGGAIAGIVVGSVAVAGVGGFAIFWFVIKKKSFADLIAIFKK